MVYLPASKPLRRALTVILNLSTAKGLKHSSAKRNLRTTLHSRNPDADTWTKISPTTRLVI